MHAGIQNLSFFLSCPLIGKCFLCVMANRNLARKSAYSAQSVCQYILNIIQMRNLAVTILDRLRRCAVRSLSESADDFGFVKKLTSQGNVQNQALTALAGRLSLSVGLENGPEWGLKALSLNPLLPVI